MWLSGLFNPQAFLTAVMQTTARRNDWALDRTVIVTEVTKRLTPDQIDAPSREGAYVHGDIGRAWGERAAVLMLGCILSRDGGQWAAVAHQGCMRLED